jgi:hypothetical protein
VDADDAFMFHALRHGRVDARGQVFTHHRADTAALNALAESGDADVVAISLGAYPAVASRYLLLPHGASVGRGYGPVLVAKRPVALAELAKSKAELDIAISATEEAAGLDPKLPTAKIVKSLRTARREIVLWEKDLLDRPPEPPAPDPNDPSPAAQVRAQIYAINRMDGREVLGLMQKMMGHDRERMGAAWAEGSRIEDLGFRI